MMWQVGACKLAERSQDSRTFLPVALPQVLFDGGQPADSGDNRDNSLCGKKIVLRRGEFEKIAVIADKGTSLLGPGDSSMDRAVCSVRVCSLTNVPL